MRGGDGLQTYFIFPAAAPHHDRSTVAAALLRHGSTICVHLWWWGGWVGGHGEAPSAEAMAESEEEGGAVGIEGERGYGCAAAGVDRDDQGRGWDWVRCEHAERIGQSVLHAETSNPTNECMARVHPSLASKNNCEVKMGFTVVKIQRFKLARRQIRQPTKAQSGEHPGGELASLSFVLGLRAKEIGQGAHTLSRRQGGAPL